MGEPGRLGLEPAERYEHPIPGALIRIDVKKLGRVGRRSDGGGASSNHHSGTSSDHRSQSERAGRTCSAYSFPASIQVPNGQRVKL